ncbi:hypothetical protein B0H13DRAFT_1917447 [Mycena leptocephala]|nr:hypothetical protein B0H13DRAFT_1917447 [Mycena leptocephala]
MVPAIVTSWAFVRMNSSAPTVPPGSPSLFFRQKNGGFAEIWNDIEPKNYCRSCSSVPIIQFQSDSTQITVRTESKLAATIPTIMVREEGLYARFTMVTNATRAAGNYENSLDKCGQHTRQVAGYCRRVPMFLDPRRQVGVDARSTPGWHMSDQFGRSDVGTMCIPRFTRIRTCNAYAICGKKYDIVNEVADVGDSSILSGHRISLSRSHPFEGRRSFVELRQECGVRIVRSYYSRRMNVEIGSRSSEGGIRRINIRRNLSMCDGKPYQGTSAHSNGNTQGSVANSPHLRNVIGVNFQLVDS